MTKGRKTLHLSDRTNRTQSTETRNLVDLRSGLQRLSDPGRQDTGETRSRVSTERPLFPHSRKMRCLSRLRTKVYTRLELCPGQTESLVEIPRQSRDTSIIYLIPWYPRFPSSLFAFLSVGVNLVFDRQKFRGHLPSYKIFKK